MFPYSLEAELSAITAAIKDTNKLNALSPEYFHDPVNKAIYEGLCGLRQKNITPSVSTLDAELATNKVYKSKKADLNSLFAKEVSDASFLDEVKQLKKLSINREQIKSFAKAQSALIDGDRNNYLKAYSNLTALSQKESVLFAPEYSLSAKTDEVLRRAYFRYKNPELSLLGLPSGITYLDNILLGFQPSDFIVVGARPAVGKSSFITTSIANTVRQDPSKTILLFSLEMSEDQIISRILSTMSNVPLSNIRTGNLTEYQWTELAKAQFILKNSNIIIDDVPAVDGTYINGKIVELKDKGQAIDLVAVDYIQLMAGTGKDKREQVSNITRDLKLTAKSYKIPLIGLSQLSRDNEKRTGADRRPKLSDLRESGTIEQDADIVIFIHRPDMIDPNDNPGVAELIVAKHRNGPTGTVYTAFIKNNTKIENILY